jgi:hypothetical protein
LPSWHTTRYVCFHMYSYQIRANYWSSPVAVSHGSLASRSLRHLGCHQNHDAITKAGLFLSCTASVSGTCVWDVIVAAVVWDISTASQASIGGQAAPEQLNNSHGMSDLGF